MMAPASKNTVVLVTGASGFIAGQCVRERLEHGWTMRPVHQTIVDTGRSMIAFGIVAGRC